MAELKARVCRACQTEHISHKSQVRSRLCRLCSPYSCLVLRTPAKDVLITQTKEVS